MITRGKVENQLKEPSDTVILLLKHVQVEMEAEPDGSSLPLLPVGLWLLTKGQDTPTLGSSP